MSPDPPLPLSVDQVTAAWLTLALRAGGADDGVDVERVALSNIVWGTATKVMLKVTYASGGEELPDRLCVKGGFLPELRALMAPGYQAEAMFYRDLAPALDGVAHCWFAGVDEQQGIVILDDLEANGATFVDARRPLTVDQVAAGLETQARWHSMTELNLPWLLPIPYFRPMVGSLLGAEHWDAHIGQTTAGPVLEVLGDRVRIGEAFAALWAAQDARPATFIHGDANPTNVYLDADGEPRFLDWQFACRSDAYHDVALFLIGALSVEDRRDHERELLRAYLEVRGEGAESFDEAWTAYRRQPLHGAMYALTPEQMQPADVRSALADRYAQAALDLETLALLCG